MSKFKSDKFVPLVIKSGNALAKAGKYTAEIVKDRHFQIGALTALPTTVSAFFLIKKYKKQAREKEKLYKKALAKHNAVIKELNAKAEICKERQERILAYDSGLKADMHNLQSEIQELKNQIAVLEKKKANNEKI